MNDPATQIVEILRRDLFAFMHRAFLELHPGKEFVPSSHLELLAYHLARVAAGECRRLIINLPPRSLKSFFASVVFPAWQLGLDPTKQIIAASYGKDLADQLARQSRKLMAAPFYQSLFATRVSANRDTVSHFETTAGGSRYSTSPGSSLTGIGGDYIIIDDPMKANDALSDQLRQNLNDWYDDTARTRLNNQATGAIIVVMQRLHSADFCAHIQAGEEWEVVSLPLVADEDEIFEITNLYGRRVIGRKTGEVLEPRLFPPEKLDELREAVTDYVYAAQFQQRPQPREGNLVKRKWLGSYKLEDLPERFDQVIQSWDTANKNSDLANFSACTTLGVYRGRFYVLDVFRKKLNFPELKRSVKFLADKYQAQVVLIEDKASGTSLIQELRFEGFNRVQPAPALDGDKIMRLHGQTAKFADGLVLLPEWASWLSDFVEELITFPNAKHDDQVDSIVYALAWATQNKPWRGWTDESNSAMGRIFYNSDVHPLANYFSRMGLF